MATKRSIGFFQKLAGNRVGLSLDEAAELLKTTPEALAAFEESYRIADIQEEAESGNFFDMNSRKAAAKIQERRECNADDQTAIAKQTADALASRIVDELLSIGNRGCLPKGDKSLAPMVSRGEIESLPEGLRPELSSTLYKKDVASDTYPIILYYLKKAMKATSPKEYNLWMCHFMQGLDIMDLDPVTYEILGCNRNSIGHWFPLLKTAVDKHPFFKIPETTIVKVPLPILQLTRLDYLALSPTTIDIVNRWAYEAFGLDENKTYFIKTGTYSSKFDFRNAKVTTPKEVRELGSYLLFIHHQAVSMAGPTVQPRPIVGASTTNEWCVREYIEDKENNPCIYHGMPLHTEYRVFIDCDAGEILGISPYWRPDVIITRFVNSDDSDRANNKHDYVIFRMHEETLMKRYEENKDIVLNQVKSLLPDLHLEGQWSLDVMQNGNDFWIIDMALAATSALSDCVPKGRLKSVREDWIPKIKEK